MTTPLHQKSTTEDIRIRFDADVERFSNLDTGQIATIDAPIAMERITRAAIAATPVIRRTLDIGCGAGNNTIKLFRQRGESFDADLVDLSGAMLDRANERLAAETGFSGAIVKHHGDFRTLPLPEGAYDVILAATVLHHLRDDADWEAAFAKIYRLTAPGGSVWITDMVAHEDPGAQALMWQGYGDYLVGVGGPELRDRVFSYVDKEDSPRPVTYQLDLLRKSGFASVDILHKNYCFAAFGAVKGRNETSGRS